MAAFVICGDFCFCGTDRRIETVEKGFLPVENGICRGVFRQLPERFACLPRLDFAGRLIIPGMTDLHLHAPQYSFRGLGMDLELLDWLSTYTFPRRPNTGICTTRDRPMTFSAGTFCVPPPPEPPSLQQFMPNPRFC